MSSDASNSSLPPKPKTEQIADVLRTPVAPHDPAAGTAPRTAEPSSAPTRPNDRSSPPSEPVVGLFDEDDAEEAREPRAKSLKEIAEEAGLSIRALQKAALDVTGADGEPMTLKQLKDHFQEHRAYQTERDEFDSWKMEAQNEVMTSRYQINDLMNRIAGLVPPQTLARAFADMELEQKDQVEKARAQVMEWYPQWRDAVVMQRDRERLVETFSRYGYNKYDIGAIRDPRMIKIGMDFVKALELIGRLREAKKEVTPSREAPSRKGHRATIDERAKALAASGNKDAAIALYLNGGKR